MYDSVFFVSCIIGIYTSILEVGQVHICRIFEAGKTKHTASQIQRLLANGQQDADHYVGTYSYVNHLLSLQYLLNTGVFFYCLFQ
jgi:hypothetical protein